MFLVNRALTTALPVSLGVALHAADGQRKGMIDVTPAAADPALTPPPDRALVLAAAPTTARPALAALLALDQRLGNIVRTTREPLVGQMRLTWWHDALVALDTMPAPAEPLLQAVQRALMPQGVSGATLATMIDGWEELIVADPLGIAALGRHAAARGAGLFTMAGRIFGADSPLLEAAGQGWALADLAAHLSKPDVAATASALAVEQISQGFSARWPNALRPIGLLSLIAGLDLANGSAVGKALRVARFRLTGR